MVRPNPCKAPPRREPMAPGPERPSRMRCRSSTRRALPVSGFAVGAGPRPAPNTGRGSTTWTRWRAAGGAVGGDGRPGNSSVPSCRATQEVRAVSGHLCPGSGEWQGGSLHAVGRWWWKEPACNQRSGCQALWPRTVFASSGHRSCPGRRAGSGLGGSGEASGSPAPLDGVRAVFRRHSGSKAVFRASMCWTARPSPGCLSPAGRRRRRPARGGSGRCRGSLGGWSWPGSCRCRAPSAVSGQRPRTS